MSLLPCLEMRLGFLGNIVPHCLLPLIKNCMRYHLLASFCKHKLESSERRETSREIRDYAMNLEQTYSA